MTLRSVWDAQHVIDAAAEQVEDSTHEIDPADPGTCPVCHAHESVVEVDYSIRWNRLNPGWNGGDVDAYEQDAEYQTIGFMCISCRTTLNLENGITDWVS